MTSIADRLREEQKKRIEQESAIQRAAKNALFGTPARSKAAEFGMKNYNSYSADDNDDGGGAGEKYDIDPSVQLWKNIDFGRDQSSVANCETLSSTATAKVAATVKSEALNSLREEWSSASTRPRKTGELNPALTEYTPTTLGSTTKGSRRNPAIVSAVLDEDYVSAQQIEDLKKALAHIQVEKDAAESKAQREIEMHKSSTRNELQRQQEELKEMMEAMKREKEEIRLRAALLEAEKASIREEAEKNSVKAMNRFHEELDVMRSQNQMLMNRMEQSQLEAKEMLRRERLERQAALSEMELENKRLTSQLIESQMKAEQQLAAEKDELKRVLLRMEAEKDELRLHISSTEERAKKEAAELEAKTASFAESIKRMETEKDQLRSLVEQNELKARDATSAVAEQLSHEKDVLKARIAYMEAEKNSLAKGLANTEAAAKQQAALLAEQLAKEKAELKENLERMEREKIELVDHLKATEKAAKEQSSALEEQIAKEKELLRTDLERMEIEKQELAARLSNNEQEIKAANEARSSQLQSEQEELRAKIQLLADEKNQLHNQLKSAEEQALAREKANNERLQQEREELMKTVQRMKDELQEERSKQVVPAEKTSAGKAAEDNPFNISPNTSLYELLEESTASSASRNNDKTHNLDPKAMASHTITTISEIEDEETKKSDAERIREELVGLPAPHIAAAMGELARLKNFAHVEASLLASFDADHRTPLFYASAYAQYETVKFLVDLKACDVLEADVNGDTALHAATSSGSIPCIEIILTIKKIAVHKKNAMGMTPGHLAKSAECLRILYRNGADLASVDNNGRSPLFVACAMNRVDCAEYLIDCLDLDDAALLICDSRGDTPLHASACNGSVDCLLLLLQHGIDPMITNAKGLKAIDLAIRNKHVKCRELLAEYHLHFCTGSDFDSVLFLATLEGHRHVKNTVRSTGSEQYDIIKRQGGSGLGTSAMKKARSMYSLNHNRSLRLQRWGSWIAYEDQEDHSKTYWYNQRTGEGQYEKPEKVAAMQDDQQKVIEKYGSESLAVNILPKKASMRLKRIGDWIQYVTENGQTFYYNEKNGDFQWVNPLENTSKSSYLQQSQSVQDSTSLEKKSNETHSDIATGGSGSFDMKSWKPFKDPESGAIFWYNSVTQVSQWECPFDNLDDEAKDAQGTAGADDDYDNEQAVQVGDDDDLGI